MALHRGTVPVDTNVILETGTEFRCRPPEHRIDQAELRRMFKIVPFAAALNPINVTVQFLNDPRLSTR